MTSRASFKKLQKLTENEPHRIFLRRHNSIKNLERIERRIKILEKFKQRTIEAITKITVESGSMSSSSSSVESLPELAVMKEPDPPQGSAITTVAEKVIFEILKGWLEHRNNNPLNSKIKFGQKILKFIDFKNVRAALFNRQKKAMLKFQNNGLELDVGPSGLDPAIDKLCDSVFFIFKELKTNNSKNVNEKQRQLNLLTDLHNLIGVFISELKQQ